MSDAPALALLIGVAFGIALEQAGMGDARKLAGQFYLRDFTVFKLMFSAIVTAMLGGFWLAQAGLIDPALIAMPETFWLPQLVGGLLFGLGFVCSGLCPGTACVAAASGSGDGLATMLGLFAGLLGCAFGYRWIEPWYNGTALGPLSLMQVFGVRQGVIVFVIVATALAAFALLERMERHR